MIEDFNIAGLAQCEAKSIEPCQRSALDELERRRDRTATKLAEIDAAISALKANPEILRVLDLLAKANR